MSLQEEVEDFFNLANMQNAETGELILDQNFSEIKSMEDWESAMIEKINWIRENKAMVLLNLAKLRKEWPKSCDALEQILA